MTTSSSVTSIVPSMTSAMTSVVSGREEATSARYAIEARRAAARADVLGEAVDCPLTRCVVVHCHDVAASAETM